MPANFQLADQIGVVLLAVLWTLLTLFRHRLTDPGLRRTALTAQALAIVSILWLAVPPFAMMGGIEWLDSPTRPLIRLLAALWWILLAVLLIVNIERFVWASLARRGVIVPRLMIDLARALVIVFTGLGIVSAIFEQTIAGLLAASGLFAVVMGFALQSTLGDMFSGIAINMQRPYRVGDWVQVDNGVLGEVTEMNWRATHLLSPRGNIIVLPNSKMAAAQIMNFNHPNRHQRQSLTLTVDARIAPAEVKAILEAGALKCSRVLPAPPPEATIREFRDGQLTYDLAYWLDDFPHADLVRHEVAEGIWLALDTLGLAPWHKVEPAVGGRKAEAERLLGLVHLFANLDAEARAQLAEGLHSERHPAGRVLVEEGDVDAKLYIVERGALEVSMKTGEGGRTCLARLGGGDCFGEMALLTNEPRGARVTTLYATTVWVVEPQDIGPLLRARPMLAEELGRIVTERRLANAATLATLSPADHEAAVRHGTAEMFMRMRAFFGM